MVYSPDSDENGRRHGDAVTRLLIENSRVWAEDRFLEGRTLVVDSGRIAAVPPAATLAPMPGDRLLDARGAFALPGFVDIHVHGSVGVDVMDGSADSLGRLCRFLARGGVTSFLATTMTDSRARIDAALRTIESGIGQPGSPLLGAHIEGPYLNPAFRGSQPATHLRHPEPSEYMPWLESGLSKLVTLAPELPGGDACMRAALQAGATVSLGHSGASYEAAVGYFEAGASQVTHTFNGMPGIHHRRPGLFTAALEHPQATFQIIPDGVHVHPAVVRLLLRLAGIERVAIITDAMQATGLGDGEFALGNVITQVKNGEARTPEGGLAGSTLTMARALRNMMRFCDLTLAEALPMATRVPARSVGVYPRKGSLQARADADIALWDDAAGVVATLIGGKLVYRAEGECTAPTAAG